MPFLLKLFVLRRFRRYPEAASSAKKMKYISRNIRSLPVLLQEEWTDQKATQEELCRLLNVMTDTKIVNE